FTIYHRTGLIRSLQPPTPPKSRPLIWFFPPHPDLLVGDSRSDSGPFSQELFFYISHFWPPEKTPRPNPGDWKNPTPNLWSGTKTRIPKKFDRRARTSFSWILISSFMRREMASLRFWEKAPKIFGLCIF